jgi:hypothetical protein
LLTALLRHRSKGLLSDAWAKLQRLVAAPPRQEVGTVFDLAGETVVDENTRFARMPLHISRYIHMQS